MNKPLDLTGHNDQKCNTEENSRRHVPAQLRRQCWWAALLLFCPWLLTLSITWPILRNDPATIAALLPGLAVAMYIERQLMQHLPANHRPADKARFYSTLGAANWITLARACGVIVLAGFLPIAVLPGHEQLNPFFLDWLPGILYLTISLADLLDGFVARKYNHETELGKILDMETDAAGLLVASLLAVMLGRLPIVYLLVGLAYYTFIIGIRLRRRSNLSVIAWRPRPYARIIAGCQMGLVAMVLLPVFDPAFSFVAGYLFMTPLLIGFVRDWLVVSGRMQTDADQQARIDYQVRLIIIRALPALRLLLVAGGIATLTGSAIYQTHPFWPVVSSLFCLMAGFGFMGRSAALLLVLLLGCNQSPFGTSILSLTVFSTAAILALAGTGSMSLWSPEESLLYRRKKQGEKLPGAAL